jgi:tetratricopeptide (TPR) repeat protein
MSRRHSEGPARRGATGRQGGPGTYAGANYQTLVGVEEAVRLLGALTLQPWQDASLSTEPRHHGPNGQVGYDIGLPNSRRRLEVKRSPTRDEVKDFVQTVADDPDARDGTTTFELVHGRGAAAVADLKAVVDLANEAPDAVTFERRYEQLTPEQQELAEPFGPREWVAFRQMRTAYRPVEHVRMTVQWITDRMYGLGPAQAVRDRLAIRFAEAAERRTTLHVTELRDELGQIGGQAYLAPGADVTGLPTHVQAALAILTVLDSPLPRRILASAVGADDTSLADINDFVAMDELAGEPAVLLSRSIGAVSTVRGRALLADVLRLLLNIASDRSQRAVALTQVRNIARLAEHLQDDDPELAADAYRKAEKPFKARGNLQLALNAARVALRASERAPRGVSNVTDEQLRARAQTLICGESWVLQRIGELDEAERVAQASLELGEHLGWKRNTAYCLKCRGRLARMRAERSNDPDDRQALLADSVNLLLAAVEAFGNSSEFGPNHPEVGDCRSLLARTFLVAGQRRGAWRELLQAQELLAGEEGQKDWADALILEAELLYHDGDVAGAARRINDALNAFPESVDSDATEITARALALRGRVQVRRDRGAAATDFHRSADLYEELEDFRRADEQRWTAWSTAGEVPAELAPYLEDESVGVRVAAVKALQRELAESLQRAVGQRRGLSSVRARQLIIDARLDADRRERRWR